MRALSPELQGHLDGGATTLARGWRLTLADGRVRGFTEHDRDLTIDGVSFRAATGFVGSAIEGQTGLAVGDQQVAGVLSDDGIDAGELASGLYDGAEVQTLLVNWADVSQRLTLSVGEIGEVKRTGESFTAELRSVAARLNVPVGRTYQAACDAVLGDARCAVDLSGAAFRGEGMVVSSGDGRRLALEGFGGFADGWFDGGLLRWTSGANAGLSAEIRSFADGTAELWQAASRVVAAGDGLVMTAGCDKRFQTCRAKFANQINFRGFPQMPGNDFVSSYPVAGARNDGTSTNT